MLAADSVPNRRRPPARILAVALGLTQEHRQLNRNRDCRPYLASPEEQNLSLIGDAIDERTR
jgi:hypothetical protein